jgi:hypothetical protein
VGDGTKNSRAAQSSMMCVEQLRAQKDSIMAKCPKATIYWH